MAEKVDIEELPARLESADAVAASTETYDVVIIGAGIAGCALATGLGNSGRRVLLLERDLAVPDRIVGELLQPGGCHTLATLGMGACLDGLDGIPVQGYEIFFGDKQVTVRYPHGERGRSFHHGRFVHALRTHARATRGVTVVEATVNELSTDETGRVCGVRATPKTGSEPLPFRAALTIAADGCFSKFRKQLLPAHVRPTTKSTFVGLILEDARMPRPEFGHVVLSAADSPLGPILVYQLDPHETRLLIDIPGQVPSTSSGALAALLKEHVPKTLPPQLVPAFKIAVESSFLEDPQDAAKYRLRTMPNSFLPPYPQGRGLPGALLVGDSLNMRHPLTGGGMTVALDDCRILTQLLGGGESTDVPTERVLDLQSWDDVSEALELWHWERKKTSTCINTLSMALYSLFGANNEYLQVLKEGCFGYFERGGECVDGPVSLLAALKPSPALLAYHFFSVAFYSLFLLFKTQPITHYPYLVYKSILVLYTATIVFVPVLWSEVQM